MPVGTNLRGRLRNTSLSLSHGLLPVFEAVVNSIHSIEEAGTDFDKGRIRVRIERDAPQPSLTASEHVARGDIIGFAITDNGIGFNDENFESFATLDTEHKVEKGGRGIGRLLWLKAFTRVEVDSTFEQDGEFRDRSFTFDASGITSKEEHIAVGAPRQRETTVRLVGFLKQYRENARKTGEAIASALLEHCLWYFVREGSSPRVVVEDEGQGIFLDDLYHRHMHSSAVSQVLPIKGIEFNLLHVKLRATGSTEHSVAYCADKRLVREERLAGRIPGLHGKLTDEHGDFVYICYVSSPLLNQHVRPERGDFNLPDDAGVFEGTIVGWDDIRKAITESAASHLDSYLAGAKERARRRLDTFVSQKAPRYRPILKRVSADSLNIDPDISDKELELTLHKALAEVEQQLLSEGHDIMAPKEGESYRDYRCRLDRYLRAVEDIKKSNLADYVAHRKVVIDLLARAIERQPNGRYQREDVIHTLIMPMRTESDDNFADDANLWLIDERLAFHEYLASDKTLSSMPITDTSYTGEPDLLVLNVFDNPMVVADSDCPASLVVVEIKRPMRDDATSEDKDPVEQALRYLRRLREGELTTTRGRPIPNAERIPGYCYVLCDLTDSVRQRCLERDMTPTPDGMGYFMPHDNLKAYVEVSSFDRVVRAARERNKAFFDKLGLPSN